MSIRPRASATAFFNCGTPFDYAGKKAREAQLEEQMAAPGFWNDQERSRAVVAELKSLRAILKPMEAAIKSADDLAAMVEIAREDPDFAAELPTEVERLDKLVEELELKGLLNGPHDACDALLTINARDGGTDANDWAEMLLRMYLAWAKDHGYETELIDRQDNEQAGINSATIAIRGPMAYGYLKGESGIHRLVRISPFNAEGKRQTSFAAVDVSPDLPDEIEVELREEDIVEQVYRASGPGGQHVNKTSSAVRLLHVPTGVTVSCQSERSQHQNRAMALKMLRARLARIEEEKREAEQAAKYKQMPKTGFGAQIRSYFLHPEQRVKDTRTGHMVGSFHSVLDGNIQDFLDAYLRWRASGNKN